MNRSVELVESGVSKYKRAASPGLLTLLAHHQPLSFKSTRAPATPTFNMQFSLRDFAFLALPLLASGAALPASVGKFTYFPPRPIHTHHSQTRTDNRPRPDTNAAAVNGTRVAALAGPQQFKRCRVNSSYGDLWVEDGMSRWRSTFSAEGTDPAGYCVYWDRHGESTTYSLPSIVTKTDKGPTQAAGPTSSVRGTQKWVAARGASTSAFPRARLGIHSTGTVCVAPETRGSGILSARPGCDAAYPWWG